MSGGGRFERRAGRFECRLPGQVPCRSVGQVPCRFPAAVAGSAEETDGGSSAGVHCGGRRGVEKRCLWGKVVKSALPETK